VATERDPPPLTAGLSRDRLVAAALELVQQHGLDALTMRALGDRLHVKAASLYWHVRDRAELLDLVAAALLSQAASVSTRGEWRTDALAVCAALERVTARRRDAARLLLEVPGVVQRSQAHASLSVVLRDAGLSEGEAAETATMMLSAVLVSSLGPPDEPPSRSERPLTVAVDSGSRGVTLRAGSSMSGVIRSAHDRGASAPAVIRGERVIVRRLRGGRHGELELNPAHAWRFQVQAPTWNTVLNLLGLDVRGIHVDSGAVRVECVLPLPRGVVPIDISSGVVGVRLRRPPGVAVVANVSPGAVQLRLDGHTVGATTGESLWESGAGAAASDYYKLRINSGTVRVTLEEDPSIGAEPVASAAAPLPRAGVFAALNVVLDGVAAHSSG
jgi:TetR/AcrR family transcriptional regulator, tetracycline repressor protein